MKIKANSTKLEASLCAFIFLIYIYFCSLSNMTILSKIFCAYSFKGTYKSAHGRKTIGLTLKENVHKCWIRHGIWHKLCTQIHMKFDKNPHPMHLNGVSAKLLTCYGKLLSPKEIHKNKYHAMYYHGFRTERPAE